MRCGVRVFLEILEDLALLARVLLCPRADGPVEFILTDGDLVGFADPGEQETEADAALGDRPVFLLKFLVGLALVVSPSSPWLWP